MVAPPTWLERYWLAGAIGITVAISLLFPEGGKWLTDSFALDAVVMAVIFLGSLKLSPASFVRVGRRLDLILISLVSLFVVAPFFSMLLAPMVGLGDTQGTMGVLLSTAQASTVAT